MNGILFSDYVGFEKNWEMVTIRFRQDSGEMRITYGNATAMKVLREGRTDFPDGSVFGKIAILTKPDPLFESSKVPAGAKRFQLMVKDQKRFSKTAGWGYALFDSKGKTFSGDQDLNTLSCAACHEIAKERGYVFSQIATFNTDVETKNGNTKVGEKDTKIFETRFVKDIPSLSIKKIKQLKKYKEIRVYTGLAKEHIFHGAADEMIPTLIKEAQIKLMPAYFGNEKDKDFSLVIPTNHSCESDNKKLYQVFKYGWVPQKIGSSQGSYLLNSLERCL
jgi:hypothetical protein